MNAVDIPTDSVNGDAAACGTAVTAPMAAVAGRVGVRWALNLAKWRPTQEEWTRAARCVQPEEKDRIGRFVFKKDSKSAMAGRLLLRRVISTETGIPYHDLKLKRTEKGKPYLSNPLPQHLDKFNFNVSHQGDYAVLAAEHCHLVGVDVMKVEYPRGSTLPEFFSRMSRQFTQQEWKFVRSTKPAHEQISRFYRIWCLKESYVKALGIGIGFELQRIDFVIKTPVLTLGVVVRDTAVLVDGELDAGWTFEETKMDASHLVAVALQDRGQATPGSDTAPSASDAVPFKTLSFMELMEGSQTQNDPDEIYWENFEAKKEKPGE